MFSVKRTGAAVSAAALVFSLAGCGSSGTGSKGIVGKWKESTVFVKLPGGETEEKDRETAASLYESEDTYYQFNEDGTMIYHVEDGGGSSDSNGTWKKKSGNVYTITDAQDISDDFTYNSSDDTLHRYWESAGGEDMYAEVDIVYARQN